MIPHPGHNKHLEQLMSEITLFRERPKASELDFARLLEVDRWAARSQDRSTGIGAVLWYAPDKSFASWNQLPRDIADTDARSERPAKYFYWEHAERNVIYGCANLGIKTGGATLYTTGVPCADCARAVIQAGLSKIVVWKRGSGLEATDRWYASINAGREMLVEAGVEIVEVERPHDAIA
jgi:dCMP deaminase